MNNCPDCGVKPDEIHENGCDVERCPDCGGQYISCDCTSTDNRLPWTGIWPGVEECREFGWYSKFISGLGWVSCDKEDPNAHENLNRLYVDAVWSKKLKRFILKD